MERVKYNGKEYPIACNMFTLIQYTKRVEEQYLNVALSKLQNVMGEGGIEVDALESWATLFHCMLEAGAKKEGQKLDLTLEDCYESTMDVNVVNAVMDALSKGMPITETERPQKETDSKKKELATS